MTKTQWNYLWIYLAAGVAFDYWLYSRNAPTGVSYSPTLKLIAGWPYYLTQVNA